MTKQNNMLICPVVLAEPEREEESKYYTLDATYPSFFRTRRFRRASRLATMPANKPQLNDRHLRPNSEWQAADPVFRSWDCGSSISRRLIQQLPLGDLTNSIRGPFGGHPSGVGKFWTCLYRTRPSECLDLFSYHLPSYISRVKQ